MGLRQLLARHRKRPDTETPYSAVWTSPPKREPLTPEQLEDLEAAWAELNQAFEESAVTSFHACTRDGRYWGEDPDAVRAMTATIRSLKHFTPRDSDDGSSL